MQETHDLRSSAAVLGDEPTTSASPRVGRRLSTVPWVRVLTVALLILILAGGAYLRFVGLDWDEDQHVHPDERFLTMVLSSLERPDSLSAFFDTATSRYNPHNTGWGFFVYGTLPIFIIRVVAERVAMTTYGEVYLVGRALSGIFDLLTVLLLFFIARRLYDTRVALLAAALNAAAVLHIQQSHFMTVDTFATTFATLAFLFAVKVAQEGEAHQYILMGLAIGMALASRINLVLLGPLAVVAAGLHVYQSLAGLTDEGERRRVVERAAVYLGAAGFVSLLAFRVFQPYAFQGPGFLDVRPNPQWLNNMREISAQASGEVDMPPNHQWTNRPAYLFPLSHMVLWGLGLPLGIAGWLGWLLAVWQMLRRRYAIQVRARHVLPVFWVLIVFGYQGQQFTKTMRYFLPIYPTLAMLAAFLLVWLWDNRARIPVSGVRDGRAGAHPTRGAVVAVAAGVLVVGGTSAWAFAFTRIYTRPEARIAASYWIYDNIPSAATLYYDTAEGGSAPEHGHTQIPVYLDSDVYGAGGAIVEPGGAPYRTSFVPEADGRLGTITFLRLEDVGDDPQTELLEVALTADPTGREPLGTRQVQLQLEQQHEPLIVDLAGVPVKIDQRYYVFLRPLAGGAVRVAAQDFAVAGRQVAQATGSVAFQTDAGPQVQPLRLSYVLQTSRTPLQYGNFLFTAPSQFIADLDAATVPAGLRQAFEEHGVSLTDQVDITVLSRGRGWRLNDPGMRAQSPAQQSIGDVFTLAAEGGQLNAYAGYAVGQKVSGFTLSEAATVRSVVLNYLIDPAGDPEAETFEVVVASDPAGQDVISQGRLTAHMEQTEHPRGEAYTVEMSAADLEAGREYYLITRAVAGAPVAAWSSVLATEHWDMPPPLRVEGKDGFAMYLGFEMENYNDDNPEKFERLLDWLDQTDYIILATNRLYGSIPRLPMRYPITTEYYRLLFAGQLGFELAQEVTSYPSLGPIEIPDQSAEEAFTVYDHPRVLIYRKTDDFSRARARALLADEAEGPFIHVKPIEVGSAPPPDLALPEQQWVRQQAAGTWSAIFNVNNPINRFAPLTILAWLLALEVVGLAVFPIAFVAFSRLADRGFVLSKMLGLLLIAWLIWFASSVTSLPYSRWSIALCFLVLVGVSAALAYPRRQALRSFWQANRRVVLIGEGLFVAAFLVFLLVRLGNPDLWHPARGGEKPMDFAYLNAVIKSRSFPPYDPWFAGGYINYYYFGFVIVGTLIKLLGVVPAEAYNLAVPTLFALTFSGAFAVVYNLTDSVEGGWRPEQATDNPPIPQGENAEAPTRPTPLGLGILGGLFVAVLGNLEQVQVLLAGLKNVAASDLRSTIPGLATAVGALRGLLRVALAGGGRATLGIPNDWWFWNASRVMPNGEINEFPYFTFVYADLHAHMIALPITLLALAMAVQVIRGAVRPQTLEALGISLSGPPRSWLARIDWPELGQLALWGLIVGALRATNTWDYPTYLLVAAGALGLQSAWRRGRIDLTTLLAAGWRFAVVVALSFLLFLPYVENYATAYTSAELWHGARTSLGDYVTIHGFFLFILGTFVFVEAIDWWRGDARGTPLPLLLQYGALLGSLVLLALVLLRMWVPALGVLLAAPALVLALRDDVSPRRRLIGVLFLLGLVLTLAVEFIVLKGDIGRMNTVFKFYIQVWVLWGVAAAASLLWLIPHVHRWAASRRQIWWGAFALLFAAAALYPLLATPAKIRDRFDPSLGPGLDGMAFMNTAVFNDEGRALELDYDQEAIRWMQKKIPGTPVVLEAQTPEYRWGSRVAIYTGLPTVVGWRWHQQQQRSVLLGGPVDHRAEDVRTMYDTPDPAVARKLLEQYDVGYIYVGQLERAYYAPPGIAKFERMADDGTLTLVYESPAVRIYRVENVAPHASLPSPDSHPLPAVALASAPTEYERVGYVAESTAQPTSQPSDRPTRRFVAFQSASDPPPLAREPDLLLDRPVDELPVIADRGWNGLANASPLLSVAVWWLVVALFGLAAWPIVAVALPSFIDRGVGLARAAGLILVGYLVWIAASLRWLRFTPWTAGAMLLSVGLLSFFVFWRRRRAFAAFLRRAWRLVLIEEVVFTGAFLLFVGIRLLNPDLWQPWFGGEKPMEFAFLNAIQKSAYFPPYDPYFAGGYINYYYYGLFLVGVVIKLTGIVPEVAFNLAVPMLFALTAANGFSLALNLVERSRGAGSGNTERSRSIARSGALQQGSVLRWRPVIVALIAVAFIAVIGNLDGVRQLLEQLQRTGNVGSFDFWRSSRVIPFTINEFPYFSFLFADLHPHMINIPFSILTLALLWSVFSNQYAAVGRQYPTGGRQWAVRGDLSSASQPILFGLLLVLTLGAVFVINTWELPACLALGLAAFVLPAVRRGSLARLLAGIVGCGIAVGLAYTAYHPFFAHYAALYVGLGTVAEGSPLKAFLTVWGFFLFVLATYVVVALIRSEGARWLTTAWHHRKRIGRFRSLAAGLGADATWRLWLASVAVLGAAVLGVVLAVIGEPVLALLAPLTVATAALLLRRCAAAGQQFLALLAFVGLGVVAGTEVVFLRDFLAGGEWYRMNTVFKFTTEAWVLLALASAVAVPVIWRWLRSVPVAHVAWWTVFAALLLASLVYPVYGTAARSDSRFPGARPALRTLNGMMFMREGEYRWPDDNVIELRYTYLALQWLLENVTGTPVVAEANIGYYREGGLRVATYTGLPVLLGFHQGEQRYEAQVRERAMKADALFNTTSTEQALDIIRELDISYIYVGQLERAWYPNAALIKFRALEQRGLLETAYENPEVTIYRVVAREQPSLS